MFKTSFFFKIIKKELKGRKQDQFSRYRQDFDFPKKWTMTFRFENFSLHAINFPINENAEDKRSTEKTFFEGARFKLHDPSEKKSWLEMKK